MLTFYLQALAWLTFIRYRKISLLAQELFDGRTFPSVSRRCGERAEEGAVRLGGSEELPVGREKCGTVRTERQQQGQKQQGEKLWKPIMS